MAARTLISRFTPSRTNPEVLEAIFVQRHKLAESWLGRLRDGVLTDAKHHLLAVGPRGSGKSHLVALLVHRLKADPVVRERVRIAWLPEDESTPSFWKFLGRILRALAAEYGDEFPPPPRDRLDAATDDRRAAVLTEFLLAKLAGRPLLVVVENLDDVMRGLGDAGQKQWRAFLQEHRVAATLATAQQLTRDLSDRDRPFFGFFQLEHLQPLTTDEALALLTRIAGQTGDTGLARFLGTPSGRARVRAIRHLTGGNHRVFIILSDFATQEKLDDLVSAFEELLDELTPYYQERLRWLPDQQREIVEYLCRATRTLPVKEIAAELFLSEQTAAAQLKSLKDKGYATAATVGRESRYELAEPLMRLCVEVKDPGREPIRLIVDFLRVWYDRRGMEARLVALPANADLERQYFNAALLQDRQDVPGPLEEAVKRDLEAARKTGDPEAIVQMLIEIGTTAESVGRCLTAAHELRLLGRYAEALFAYDRATVLDPNNSAAWCDKGHTLASLWRYSEALVAYDRATVLDPQNSAAWNNKGYTLHSLGRYTEALIDCDQAIKLDPKYGLAWRNKGNTLSALGRNTEALTACDRVTQLNFNDPAAWSNKGHTLNALGHYAEAMTACERAIELDPQHAFAIENRGRAKLGLSQIGEAMADFNLAITIAENGTSGALEGLAEGHILLGNWSAAETASSQRFRLASGRNNPPRSWHLPEVLTAVFRSSADSGVWADRIGRLADIAREAQDDWDRQKAANPATAVPTKPLAVIADSLVRSLTSKFYAESLPGTLEAWAEVWREVAGRHPDFALAARLFGVGVRYVRTKDERVLLDLLQEERAILRDLFRLGD